jgi:predicted nucleic acid-binding protein
VKLRVYLDTSVFSAYCDERVPERQALTQEFWQRFDEFEVTTSDLALEELREAGDDGLRARFEGLLANVAAHPVTQEIRDLARCYLAAGVFSPAMLNDALHVAAAVLTRQDVLLSWNFKHLVNRRRRAQVNEVNVSQGLPTIEIIAPPEI